MRLPSGVCQAGGRRLRLLSLGLWLGVAGISGSPVAMQTWYGSKAGFNDAASAPDIPMAVGSLQKPFVARAWAEANPGQVPPQISCTPSSGCWLRHGHGTLGLAKATSVSCNTYFRHLAATTPLPLLTSNLTREGFQGEIHSPEAALGLPDGWPLLRIRPSALLEAYRCLVSVPWAEGEPLRGMVLAGLREAALTGTAGALKHRGFWAKTGTIPSTTGNALQTCGLALAVDDAGWAVLGRREPGTGREAAAALAGRLTSPPSILRAQSNAPGERLVSLRLFDLLRPRRWRVCNLSSTPVPCSQGGFLGPGATQDLASGDWAGPGLLEIEAVGTDLRRRLLGRVQCRQGRSLQAVLTAREYAGGVIAAELPTGTPAQRLELGAAVLRFLAQGPRHGEIDVCDSTHCAWFIGRGPRVDWLTTTHAITNPASQFTMPQELSDQEWAAIRASSQQPGPRQWSSHCGGIPLSPHFLWGNGDWSITACPRHGGLPASPWQRLWKGSDLEKAFGVPVAALSVDPSNGVWLLKVRGPLDTRHYRYDEAHQRLATVMGWGALPSPAESISPTPAGFLVTGTGFGHRVGLCLGE